ncbi:MAG: enoyl-CoA hydratase/isomerase family protein [Alphaproteobacteria bacterium]|nr:enoyl-CoA hydratase/isomerase family protein [Alphaproteobacteria bacterium]
MAEEELLVEKRGAVARLVINRPDRLNSLRMGITDRAILDALRSLGDDDDTKVVLLTGAGQRAFCTGWDLEAIDETSLADLERMIRTNLELFFGVWNAPIPVIAAINGYAVGTGSALALACDLSLAADNTRLGEPEIRHGALSPFLALPFMTHSKAVHEIYYTGDLVDAAELYRLGLVNRVVPADELEETSWRYAERLAKVPGFSLQMTKRSLRAAYDVMGFTSAIRQHGLADTLVIGADFPEQRALLDILVKQGMRAFLDARDGPFREKV